MSKAERAEYRERYTLTNWEAITNTKRKKKGQNKMRKITRLVDFQESTTNEYGIPKDPEAAVKMLAEEKLKVTDKPDEVDDGVIIETYSITVKGKDEDKDTVYYESKTQPFAWKKVSNLVTLLAEEKATLTDEQIDTLGKALSSDDEKASATIGKAVKSLIEVYNSNTRANAKGADYQRILNLKAPMTEETKGKRVESMIAMFASINRVSLDVAREKMKAAGLI
jgi:hypothetical protein